MQVNVIEKLNEVRAMINCIHTKCNFDPAILVDLLQEVHSPVKSQQSEYKARRTLVYVIAKLICDKLHEEIMPHLRGGELVAAKAMCNRITNLCIKNPLMQKPCFKDPEFFDNARNLWHKLFTGDLDSIIVLMYQNMRHSPDEIDDCNIVPISSPEAGLIEELDRELEEGMMTID